MRRHRRMTAGDRVELGIFIALMAGGLVILTSAMKMGGTPRMAAWSDRGTPDQMITQASAPVNAGPAQPAVGGQPPFGVQPGIPMQPPLPQWMPQSPDAFPVAPSPLPVPADQVATGRAQDAPVARKVAAKPPEDTKTFDGRKYRFVRTIKLRVTAYAPDPRCTYPFPGTTTASGKSVKTNGGRLVAADTAVIPMKALVVVPGYAKGAAVPVLDRGGAIKGSRLDVLLPTFGQAQEWGTKELEVKVYEPVK